MNIGNPYQIITVFFIFVLATKNYVRNTLKLIIIIINLLRKGNNMDDKINMKTMSQTGIRLYQEGGLKRLYTGVTWRATNVIATVYIVNELQIRLTPFFSRI